MFTDTGEEIILNPWDLSASELLIWGIVLHLIADWPLQNDWMANNKMHRARYPWNKWWARHPAAYAHMWIHILCLTPVFGLASAFIGVAHLVIDCRWPVVWWSKLVKQTQPSGRYFLTERDEEAADRRRLLLPVYDVGTEVRIWTDQVFHIVCIAAAALLVTM